MTELEGLLKEYLDYLEIEKNRSLKINRGARKIAPREKSSFVLLSTFVLSRAFMCGTYFLYDDVLCITISFQNFVLCYILNK